MPSQFPNTINTRTRSVDLSPTTLQLFNTQPSPYHDAFSESIPSQFSSPIKSDPHEAFSSFFTRLRQSNRDRVEESTMVAEDGEDVEKGYERKPRFKHVHWEDGYGRKPSGWFVVVVLMLEASILLKECRRWAGRERLSERRAGMQRAD